MLSFTIPLFNGSHNVDNPNKSEKLYALGQNDHLMPEIDMGRPSIELWDFEGKHGLPRTRLKIWTVKRCEV